MSSAEAVVFMQGASTLASALIALFFLRYWRDTGDRLFMIFALAFAVFAVNRFALMWLEDSDESGYLYLVRLATFVLILGAIIDKNSGGRASRE